MCLAKNNRLRWQQCNVKAWTNFITISNLEDSELMTWTTAMLSHQKPTVQFCYQLAPHKDRNQDSKKIQEDQIFPVPSLYPWFRPYLCIPMFVEVCNEAISSSHVCVNLKFSLQPQVLPPKDMPLEDARISCQMIKSTLIPALIGILWWGAWTPAHILLKKASQVPWTYMRS